MTPRRRVGDGLPGRGAGDKNRVDLVGLDGLGEVFRIDQRNLHLVEWHAVMIEYDIEQILGRNVPGHDADAATDKLPHFLRLVAGRCGLAGILAALVAAGLGGFGVVTLGGFCVLARRGLVALAGPCALATLGASFLLFSGARFLLGRRARLFLSGDRRCGCRNDQRHHVLSQDGDHRPIRRVADRAGQNGEVGVAARHRLRALFRSAGSNELQLDLVAVVPEFLRQDLDKFCVGAVSRPGGNPHDGRCGGQIDRCRNTGAENDRPQNCHEPSVPQKSSDPISYDVLQWLDTHGIARCVTRHGRGRLAH